jgi:hypothetical protein
MKQGPFAPGRLCCPPPHSYYDPLRLLSAGCHFPGSPVIDSTASQPPQGRGRGGPLQFPRQPSNRSTPPAPGGSLAPAPGPIDAVHGLRPRETGSAPPCPAHRAGVPNDAADFASCCGPVSCSPPHRGFVAPLRPPGSHPRPGAALPRTLASPRTGLTPAGCRELVARLRHDAILSVMAPELLDALPAGTPEGYVRRLRCCDVVIRGQYLPDHRQQDRGTVGPARRSWATPAARGIPTFRIPLSAEPSRTSCRSGSGLDA